MFKMMCSSKAKAILYISVIQILRLVDAATCPLTFDGRVPKDATKSFFASAQSPFDPKYVLGQNLTWDQVISFPDVPTSRWDDPANGGTYGKAGKAIEITIDDSSIFASTSEGAETALRRAELLVDHNTTTVTEYRLWHFSVRTSPRGPLNYTHEYVLAFHESQDYQADFWSVKAGLPLDGTTGPKDGKTLYVQGYKWANPVTTYFSTPFTEDVWHNFGIHLDYPNNMIEILYSKNNDPLKSQTSIVSNNLTGKAPTTLGEVHFGLQKKPVGANSTNYLYSGTQEKGIKEALIYGGIWQENSQHHCLTL